jgi:sialic acid synthase SpsE
MHNKIQFIAEVSSNHGRDLARSLNFIRSAAKAGCSAVKFQLFKIDELFAPNTLPEKERERRRKWELPLSFLPELAACCEKENIEFSCTPFYLEAVQQLKPYVNFYKIASYELLWDDLLAACAATGKQVILSTGMATMPEILGAVDVLKRNGCSHPILLHCTSAYPTPYDEANLSAIETLRLATGCEVGWSDHTVEPAVLYRAINHWGAKYIEFHYDLDGEGEEFSGGHCWLPDKVSEVIRNVKIGIVADGEGEKKPTPSEISDRMWRADPSDGLRPLAEMRKQLKVIEN